MKKILTREDLINFKFDLCLPLSLFNEDCVEESMIVEILSTSIPQSKVCG